MTLPIVILWIICTSRIMNAQADCNLDIRPSTVADSWQSSSYLENNNVICFKYIDQSAPGTYLFLHTAISNASDSAGFHWFAVQLKQLTALTSVTIKIRVRDSSRMDAEVADDLISRSANIEVWTSASEKLYFGSNHCSGASISSLFHANKSEWTLCGTSSTTSAAVSSMQLNVNCNAIHPTRLVVLRKAISDEKREARKCMSFNDMRISNIDFETVMNASGPVVQNSSLAVRCSKSCITTETQPFQLSLCHPNGQCFDRTEIHIHRVQPWDSGNFTCQLDGHVVSSARLIVQYPPEKLEIAPPSSSSCSDESRYPVFTVTSSAAAPTPEHRCILKHSAGETDLMKIAEHELVSGGSVRSQWLCSRCLKEGATGASVQCTASQLSLPWSSRAIVAWQCDNSTVNWTALLAAAVSAASAAALGSVVFVFKKRLFKGRSDSKKAAADSKVEMESVYDLVMQIETENIYDTLLKCT